MLEPHARARNREGKGPNKGRYGAMWLNLLGTLCIASKYFK